jgi:adenine C2-methylase RlmN of 23S rRNA A2503 and tRNA A37
VASGTKSQPLPDVISHEARSKVLQKCGRLIEFVEECQPPYGRAERWILMVSTLYGCPVKCLFCDAGGAIEAC